ncbi:hypothetical protein PsYK624_107240 [Phanerochaete sordida]|uniref:Uncharacterized protein n=1 Tax=Phanerochaete sordida TaxID=48140 RepID=A0A9P3LHD2_9APHY|nr:hypothetical protein PsYK624_107240 [Phanerochaete sordida]
MTRSDGWRGQAGWRALASSSRSPAPEPICPCGAGLHGGPGPAVHGPRFEARRSVFPPSDVSVRRQVVAGALLFRAPLG